MTDRGVAGVAKPFKATAEAGHPLPLVLNLLLQDFVTAAPGEIKSWPGAMFGFSHQSMSRLSGMRCQEHKNKSARFGGRELLASPPPGRGSRRQSWRGFSVAVSLTILFSSTPNRCMRFQTVARLTPSSLAAWLMLPPLAWRAWAN